MTVKSTFIIMAFATAILGSLQTTNAQNTSPFWSLAGNSNATASSKLGTTNAIPVRLMTNNRTRVFIDASGKVGIGTSTPTLGSLVVNANAGASHAIFGSNTAGVSIVSSNNFPTIGFNSYYNGGWKNISNGFAGIIDLNPSGSWEFFNSDTSGTTGNQTSLINRMVITNNGFVGIGTITPGAAQLSVVNKDFGDGIKAVSVSGNGIIATTNNASKFAGFFNGNIFSTGTFSSSDEKLKQNIRDFSSAMSIINGLHPKLYQFKKEGNYALMNLPQGDHYGLIAQEVEKVLPNLVKETKFDTRLTKPGADREKSSPSEVVDFKALNYTELIPIMIKAIQELSQQNEDLQKQVNEMKATPSASAQSKTVLLTDASLEQNIPNPFNHNTTVNYSLPQKFSNAQIIVNDKTGKVLKQINISGTGKGTVNIDASTLSAGVYSYSLIIDGKLISTKQMILSK